VSCEERQASDLLVSHKHEPLAFSFFRMVKKKKKKKKEQKKNKKKKKKKKKTKQNKTK
jgi:hypothetical protein